MTDKSFVETVKELDLPSRRDIFAAAALQGLLATGSIGANETLRLAEEAALVSQAMIDALDDSNMNAIRRELALR